MARLPEHLPPLEQNFLLTLNLVLDGTFQGVERVHVLHLDPIAPPSVGALQGHVSVEAHHALLQVRVRGPGVAHPALEGHGVLNGLLRGGDVRLRDDLRQRHPRAIVINVGRGGPLKAAVGSAVVKAAHVLLHMQMVDADPLQFSVRVVDLDVSLGHDGQIALGDLMSLGQIGIEVGLTVEQRLLPGRAVERHARQHPLLNHVDVEARQGAGKPHAHWADVGVGRDIRVRGAAAEYLGVRLETDVDLDADDRRKCEFVRHVQASQSYRPAILGEPRRSSRTRPAFSRSGSLQRGPMS